TAYGVLTDPEQRDSYQERWWPTHPSTPAPETDPYLEIAPAQLMGGLLLLQDLGEYEEVLKLAEAELYRPEDPATLQTIRADLILITALAYLELGRESWQRSDYETAAATVLKGLAWLQREAQFPEVQNEIREELFRLRPYRILELVADPDLDSPERATGLQLLQEMIPDRFGIEGRGNERSGLGIDDFL
ncbi:MAG: molecular chaperone DnaJ, partial [Microcystaceae cyanobacterium]